METYTNGFCGCFSRFVYGRYLKTVEACLLFATNKYVDKSMGSCLLAGQRMGIGRAPDREKGIGNSISQSIGNREQNGP